jgi:arsenical pump membrane protein
LRDDHEQNVVILMTMSLGQAALAWGIAGCAIAGVLFRPKGWPEAVWACLGAAATVACGLITVSAALRAVAKGTEVYLFLTGMMLLAELGRREGVFDWLAALAERAAKGSRARLFALIYAVGVLVAVFLSNDATAVVLTPAVYAAVKRERAGAAPYLFICAFIANAASFVLPISNPANLVVYGKDLPPLGEWVRMFLAPSACAIAATFAAMWWLFRRELRGGMTGGPVEAPLTREGKRAAWGLAGAAAALVTASALGWDLGLPTCLAALVAMLATVGLRVRALGEVARGAAWSVLPLVAGLFVLVEAVNGAGAMAAAHGMFEAFARMPGPLGNVAAAFSVAGISNVVNNLPSGLLAGSALASMGAAAHVRNVALIGVDLGPNLSVTGSLATVLWLIALRREGVEMGAWRFLKAGVVVTPGALLLAALTVG